jgi:hypothetical protein
MSSSQISEQEHPDSCLAMRIKLPIHTGENSSLRDFVGLIQVAAEYDGQNMA